MSDCCFNGKTQNDVLIHQLKREVEKLIKDTNARLLIQDGKIASVCAYIKENLSATLMEMLDSMKIAGELDSIIANALSSELSLAMRYIDVSNVVILNDTTEYLDITYELQTKINSGIKRITLIGNFVLDEIKPKTDTKFLVIGNIRSKSGGSIFILDSVNNVEIVGGSYFGNKSTETQETFYINNSNGCLIKDVRISDCVNKGISFVGKSERNNVENVYVTGCNGVTGAGVSLYGSEVQNNFFNNITCEDNRIGLTINGSNYNKFSNIVCSNNSDIGVTVDGIVTDSGDGGCYNIFENVTANNNNSSAYGGIFIGNGSSYNTFNNVVANGNKGGGIKITNSAINIDCKRNSFSNIIVNNNEIGMAIALATSTTINNVTAEYNSNRGLVLIQCDNSKVTTGKIANNTNQGVYVQSGYCNFNDIEITGNGHGLIIAYGGTTHAYNIVSGCTFKDNSGADCDLLNNLNKAINCVGYVTENSGVINKFDNQTIAHGLSSAPTYVSVMSSNSAHICRILSVNEVVIQISLVDENNEPVTVEEAIYWMAKC